MLKPRPGCFFFVVAPFCSCPASLVSRKFFAVGPGCAKCSFFCCAPLGAATFRRGQSKKKTPRVFFFFCSDPGERQGKEKPRAGTGPAQKKKTPPRVFFLLRPRGKAGEGEVPLGAGTGPEQKKTPPRVFFFCSGPVPAPDGASPSPAFPFSFPCLSTGPEPKKKNTLGGVFFFALAPCRRPTGLRRGRSKKKKHPGWCFFFCSGPVPARGFSFPCLSPGSEQKKNTLGGVFLLRPRADAHSLTAGLGGDASPSPGWCLFFCCGAGPDRGGVFFLLWPRPDAHSLTVGWGDFGKARVVFFFLLRPRRVFLDNNKKCLEYYIGSKKTRRGHSKKKKHHFLETHTI